MGFFYSLSCVLVPLTLLIYRSFTEFKLSGSIAYGKWTLMLIAVYLFDWLSWFFEESLLILFMDFVLKVVVPFIPDSLNFWVQQQISKLRMEVWLDQFRCWIVSGLYQHYWKVTEYILSKMSTQENKQFRQGLLLKINDINPSNQQINFKPQKQFSNVGVNCDDLSKQITESILTAPKTLSPFSSNINEEKFKKSPAFSQIRPSKLELERNKQFKTDQVHEISQESEELPRFNYNKTQRIPKPQSMTKYSIKEMHQKVDFPKNENPPMLLPQRISPIQAKQKNDLQIRHVVFQTSQFNQQSEKNQYQPNPTSRKTYQKQPELKRTFTFKEFTASEISTKLMKPYREDGEIQSDDLINRLQISSSEYSDMFDDEDEDQNRKVLECKVEVILQIGTGSTARLEIYNLELYSNADLRIVSLYDREFQSHKLKCMRCLPNNYYELVFEKSKIQSRKCKFRGQHQSFLKYLEK